MNDDLHNREDFRGVARLFPLPNLVLFPSVVQPLHIFEPRYRAMMADALDGDRLLAIVLLQPGWEEDYENRPPVHRVACLGRISSEERLPDGRFNLLLHGLRRIRIEEELPAGRPYREARVQLLEDIPCADLNREKQLRAEMNGILPALLAAHGGAASQARKLLEGDVPLGTLVDIFTFALPMEAELKQHLLEELDVLRRTETFLALLHQLEVPDDEDSTEREFPPEFSEN